MHQLLQGIKVLDLTRLLPGPLCSLYLAELGAEVIKVEPPEGDDVRKLSPQLYKQLNWPKQLLSLDLKKDEDKHSFLELVKQSHVVIESFRPGVTRGLGIDFDKLKTISPSLVYCSITGYGQTGPYRGFPGHDINYLATAGVLEQMEGLPNFQIADIAGGSLSACVGILAALLDSQKNSRPHFIDISMLDCTMALNQVAFSSHVTKNQDLPPDEGLLSGALPFYDIYKTFDQRQIALGALEAKFWKNFCEALGKAEWIPWHSRPKEHYPEIRNELSKLFRSKTMREWEHLLKDKDCCVSPALNISESLKDPQVLARNLVLEKEGFKTIKFPLIISP